MSVDGAWIGDPESTPCEMGGGSVVDYRYVPADVEALLRRRAQSGGLGGGKTYDMVGKLALQVASGAKICFVCNSKAQGDAVREQVEARIRWAGLFPVKKYMKQLTVQHPVGR